MSKQWPKVKLGDLLTRVKDAVIIQDDQMYARLTIRMNGKGIVQRDRVPGHDIGTKKQFIAHSGQLVLSKIDARNGAFGILLDDCDNAIITGNFWAFDTNTELLLPTYFDYLTKTPMFVDFCIRASEGTTNRLYLQEDKFLAQEISLPPLAEQRRIVARIEELAAQIAEAKALRKQAAEEAEALGGALANRLFSESASIRAIEDIAEVRGGIQKSPKRAPGVNPVRYLTVAHVQRNRVLTGDPRFFEVTPAELERWRLKAGDVLIIEGNGSAEQIGRTALFRGEIENCVHQNHIIRIRPETSLLDPEFLNAFLNSPAGQDAVQDRSRTTSGLRTLSVGRIKKILVPLPPLSEQRRIVAQLDALQAEMDKLKLLQSETAAELDALLPSILDKAFKGEL